MTHNPLPRKSATVYRLVASHERVARAAVDPAAKVIQAMNLPDHVRARLEHELYRLAEPDHSRNPWGAYAMLSVQQMGAIWDAIRKLPASERPGEVRHVLDLILLHLRQDTGEIMLTRQELAERMDIQPGKVSKALGVLERLGVIYKGDERRKVPGLKGPGLAVYFVNPHAAWNGSLELRRREAARRALPLFRAVEGGKR